LVIDRRDFLSLTAAAAIGSTCHTASATVAKQRRWSLAAETGLFECDALPGVSDQVRFAAEHGFRTFLDDSWLARSSQERTELSAIARDVGILWGPFRGPRYSCALQDDWLSELHRALDAAAAIGLNSVRIEFPSREWCPCGSALDDKAIDAAAERGLTILAEPLVCATCAYPRALRRFAEQVRSACALSVDVYRLAASGIDPTEFLDCWLPHVGHIELADFPGGLEPGSGGLDLRRMCALLDQHAYTGVVGLRHGRSQTGRAGVNAVLAACAQLNRSSVCTA